MDAAHLKKLFGSRVLLPAESGAPATKTVYKIITNSDAPAPAVPAVDPKSIGPGPWFRMVPTNPAFYPPCGRPDGYRVQAVHPSFLRPGTANLIKADGSFSEVGAEGAVVGGVVPTNVAGVKGAGVSATGATSGVAGALGAESEERDLRDTTLYSKFDADGFPTHDKDGTELTKSQYKKVRKLIEGDRKKAAKKQGK